MARLIGKFGAAGTHYGWCVLAAAFVAEMFAIGGTAYAFGLFVKPVCAEFGISRATANSGMMLFYVGMGLSAPLIGWLLDRRSARVIVAGGALALGAGMVGIGLASSLPLIAALLLVMVGAGAVASGPMSANVLAVRWFDQHRGKALGIAAVATSLGGTLIVPMMAMVLEQRGWRAALIVQGVLTAVLVGTLAWWVIRDRPPQPLAAAAVAPPPRLPLGTLLRMRDFWCIALAVGAVFAINQAVLITMIPYATDAGIALEKATLLVSCLAGSSVIGKLLFGAIADRYDRRWLLLFCIACNVLLLVALALQPGFAALLAICCVAGVATGGELPVWAALVGERFGAHAVGSVLGLMNPVMTVVSLCALRFVGEVFDRSGRYEPAFQVFIVVALLASVLVLAISRRPGSDGGAGAALTLQPR